MTDPIPLADYIALEYARLDEFATWYAEQAAQLSATAPCPMAMFPADWWDQYIAWAQS